VILREDCWCDCLSLSSSCAVPSFAVAAKPKPHCTLTGRVVAIADGDALTVLDAEKVQHKVRLAGIDAPAKGEPLGTKAREALARKVFGQDIRVDVIDVASQ
jgi:endonuclease YncB( thermonuclease family)